MNEHDLEMQALLLSDIGDVGTVGPHSSLSAGPTTAKRVGAGRVQQAAEAFVQSSVPSDLLSDVKDAGRDLYKYSMTKAGLRKLSIPRPDRELSPGLVDDGEGQDKREDLSTSLRDTPSSPSVVAASGI